MTKKIVTGYFTSEVMSSNQYRKCKNLRPCPYSSLFSIDCLWQQGGFLFTLVRENIIFMEDPSITFIDSDLEGGNEVFS